MIWGDPIEVNGILPAWLADDERIQWMKGQDWRGPCDAKDHNWGSYIHTPNTETAAIRLPADHFAYLAIAKGFEPWGGGDSPPEDWDSGYVLCRDGREGGGFRWKHDCGQRDIIGYKRKPTAIDGDYVSVKRMTEEEVIDGRFRQYSTYGPLTAITEAFRDLGLIRHPTQAETIATKTGLTVDQVQSVLNEVNNGTR